MQYQEFLSTLKTQAPDEDEEEAEEEEEEEEEEEGTR
jgi:hypothetical protein